MAVESAGVSLSGDGRWETRLDDHMSSIFIKKKTFNMRGEKSY